MKLRLVSLAILASLGIASAQTVSVLPNAETQFLDGNGAPYAAGKVYFYVPGTTTPKATWVDTNATTLNSNPVVLDSAGRALIYGSGQYREVLQDQFGNIIWDQLTWAPNPSTNTTFANGTLAGNSSGAIGGLNAITVGSGLSLVGSTLSAAGVYPVTVVDTTNQTVGSSFNNTQRLATGSITYTLPLANTLPNGFSLRIYALTGNVTVTPYSTDTIQGQTVGQSLFVAQGSVIFLTTNAAGNWYYSPPIAATADVDAPCGRLTLTSGVPVLTSAVTSATAVIYTPYICNEIPIVEGGIMQSAGFSEYSQLLSDTTLSPSAAAANSVYDIFAWLNGTNVVFTRGPAWSSTTSRGYSLSRVSGMLVNTFGITNGPGAGAGTLVGTIMTDTSTATITFAPNPAAASGGPTTGSGAQNAGAWVGLWNMYNRVNVTLSAQDSKASWTYSTAAWRQSDNSNNNRVTWVTGQSEDSVWAQFADGASAGSASMLFALGLDNVSGPNGTTGYVFNTASTAIGVYVGTGVLGQHYFQALENAQNGTSATVYGAPATAGLGGQVHQVLLNARY